MKGFVIKWKYDCYEECPCFGIWQVPVECVIDFYVVDVSYDEDRLVSNYPFYRIECQIVAPNKKVAIQKFCKKYGVVIKGSKQWASNQLH